MEIGPIRNQNLIFWPNFTRQKLIGRNPANLIVGWAGNNVGDEGEVQLAQVLECNSTLTLLHLTCACICHDV